MSLTLPLRQDAQFYDFDVELEGITYTFEFRWNVRAQAWHMSILDRLGNHLITGRRIVLEFPLTFQSVNPDLPPGVFYAVDTSGLQTPPGENDFGTRVVLLYFESTELPL